MKNITVITSTGTLRPKSHCTKISGKWFDMIESIRTKKLSPISFGGSCYAYIQRAVYKGQICYNLRHKASSAPMFGYWPGVHPSRKNVNFDCSRIIPTLAAAEIALGKL